LWFNTSAPEHFEKKWARGVGSGPRFPTSFETARRARPAVRALGAWCPPEAGALAVAGGSRSGYSDNNVIVGAGGQVSFGGAAAVDVNSLLPAGTGWTLQTITGINDSNHIVGTGTFTAGLQGNSGLYLLTGLTPSPDTWTGKGSNNLWSNPDNWSGNRAPAAGDNLIFPTGAQQETSINDLGLTFGSITTADTYSFSGQDLNTSSLTVQQGSLELGSSATVTGMLTVASGATLLVGANETLTMNGTASVAGSLQAAGNMNLDGGTLDIPGTVTASSGGTLDDQGTVTVPGTLKIDQGGAVKIGRNGVMTFPGGGSLDASGTVTIEACRSPNEGDLS
jgi:hypothetical protein